VACVLAAVQSRVDMKYTANLQLIFKDDNSYDFTCAGRWIDARMSGHYSRCFEVTDNSTSIDDYTAVDGGDVSSSSYCNDGTKVADTYVDLDTLISLCPQDYTDVTD
jgi:hypothetical protein